MLNIIFDRIAHYCFGNQKARDRMDLGTVVASLRKGWFHYAGMNNYQSATIQRFCEFLSLDFDLHVDSADLAQLCNARENDTLDISTFLPIIAAILIEDGAVYVCRN